MNAGLPPDAAGAAVSPHEAQALFTDLAGEPALLAAVSGGPDSMALLGLLAQWSRLPGRPALLAATVDHGLRAGSAAEAEMVARICADLGVPHALLRWEGAKPASGLQSAARTARYRLLGQEAARHGGAVLVTAHTRDDQAETLLMRMAHGSGPSGLVGMRPRSRRGALVLARPLLGLSKARLVATTQALGLPFVTDPSNEDLQFERVRWRRLTPALDQAGLSAERLATLARRLARLESAIEPQLDALATSLSRDGGEDGVDARELFAAPEEISLRMLGRLVGAVADEPTPPRLDRLEQCHDALRAAAGERAALTRTLAGCVILLDRSGRLRLHREGPRKRGVHPATS